jgi:hypothetical protein
MITLGEPEVIVLGELDATSLAELGVITLPELRQGALGGPARRGADPARTFSYAGTSAPRGGPSGRSV